MAPLLGWGREVGGGRGAGGEVGGVRSGEVGGGSGVVGGGGVAVVGGVEAAARRDVHGGRHGGAGERPGEELRGGGREHPAGVSGVEEVLRRGHLGGDKEREDLGAVAD